jgi:hypothetical protein
MVLAHGGTTGAVLEGLLLVIPLVIFFALNAMKNRRARAEQAEAEKKKRPR